VYLFQPEDKVRWIQADFTNYASSNFEGESEPTAIPLYYRLARDLGEDVTLTVYQGDVAIAELEGPGEAGLHRVDWGMDRRRERSQEEQQSMRERFERFGAEPDEDQVRWITEDAAPGDYRVVLEAGGARMEREVSILRDEWWMMRR